MVENMVLAMLLENDDDGPLISLKVVILAIIAGGICAGCGMFCRLVFKWGNKGKRFQKRKREKKAATKELAPKLGSRQLSDSDRMQRALDPSQRKTKKKRGFRETLDKARLVLAWAINIAFYLMFTWFIITYASLFGPAETRRWLMSWLIGSGNAWMVIEPFEVIVLVMLPFLFDNSCVANCREASKEMGLI